MESREQTQGHQQTDDSTKQKQPEGKIEPKEGDITLEKQSSLEEVVTRIVELLHPESPKFNANQRVNLKAIGKNIPNAILVAEIVRSLISNLHQINELSNTSIQKVYESKVKGHEDITTTKTVEQLQITLTHDATAEDQKKSGYQLIKAGVQTQPIDEIKKIAHKTIHEGIPVSAQIVQPAQAIQPVEVVQPAQPVQPVEAVQAVEVVQPAQAVQAAQPVQPVEAVQVAQNQEIIQPDNIKQEQNDQVAAVQSDAVQQQQQEEIAQIKKPPISLHVSSNKNNFLVKIQQNNDTFRGKHDIVCLLDTSGSMQVEAQVKNVDSGQKEAHGLSVLELLKQAVKTTYRSLNEEDRFALVTFSNQAHVNFKLQYMTDSSKQEATEAVNKLHADGQTNLWAGLYAAMEELRKGFKDKDRHATIVLMTDGEPNVFPPSGYIKELQKYQAAHQGFFFALNTLAMGKKMDSVLLNDLATTGHGIYSFIPCPGFVGTIIVNTLANILITAGVDARLHIKPLNGAQLIVDKHSCHEHTFRVGDIKYGQTRDFVFEIRSKDHDPSQKLFKATLVYYDYATQQRQEYEVFGDSLQNAEDPNVDFHLCRFEFLQRIDKALHDMKKNDQQSAKHIVKELADKFNAVLHHMKGEDEHQLKIAHESLQGLIKDVEKEVRLAFEQTYSFEWWGRHYIPSLMNAHSNQLVNNFIDPGIQIYGGKLFVQLRDIAGTNFLQYDYVQPNSYDPGDQSRPVEPAKPAVNMSAYYDAGGGCFHGDSIVQMADGTSKQVRNIRKGDILMGSAKVEAVVKIKCARKQTELVKLEGGLLITPNHPIWLESSQRWVKPYSVAAAKLYDCTEVYNFVLDSIHTMRINGVICVTLGHKMTGEGIEHPYFGTERVLNDLKQLSGWSQGLVQLQMDQFQRDNQTQKICGFRAVQLTTD